MRMSSKVFYGSTAAIGAFHLAVRRATSHAIINPLTLLKCGQKPSSSMARTYDSALSQLSALQSNFAVHSLFGPPALSASDVSPGKTQDLNALAIPEMLAWLGRAGLATSDLAKLKCIHVAGTKGKGSVCAYLTSILTQSPFRSVAGRVGTYTSPHLVTVRERIMLDGQPISQELFTKYFFEVWDAFTASARAEFHRQNGDKPAATKLDTATEAELQGPATKPFYFRFLTIMAFHVFLREGVRSAVVECGIGGEYDSTNVLPAAAITASVVTQLGIDHVGMLGGTLPEIAWHKMGVAKLGRKCFTRNLRGETGARTMEVIRNRAQEIGAELVEVADQDVETWGGVKAEGIGGLEGSFQKYNQALAVAAANEHLAQLKAPFTTSKVFDDLPSEVNQGLQHARLRGRCETREDGNITWLIDGAHTAESLQEVAKWYASKRTATPGSQMILMFNQQQREAGRLLQVLLSSIAENGALGSKIFDRAVFTRNELDTRAGEEPERDLSVQKAAAEAFKEMCPGKEAAIFDNVTGAVEFAESTDTQDAHSQKKMVLVTGSLHLVGALLRILEPEAPI
ncbi:hypothetical protein JX266_000528 [Neoarthrinium moseri]|uniref:uncharacterized protein n=1 Tax=Neoarthrinium moseri TaxID=1658444 RepID=UPI001FDC0796|nr:uncharacterized protein JN550_004283 [Neoarthrinium moseri]KAI1855663.1 hypothetical protein JX266_000528 [Neoarthrinium moseri]KAI1872080.1 hypothetical protein JN550_004283 [Neoarthrinium moseri]